MVTAAAMHGIDLTLMWGTFDRTSDGRPVRVRQVCLGVPGAGGTVAVVLSGPGAWGPEVEHAERVAALEAACADLTARGRIRLAQALPEPDEVWAVRAFREAGFRSVGELAYLRRPSGLPPPTPPDGWPEGVEVRPVRGFEPDRALLVAALDRSYEKTLDCPELCGLRETTDVLESHRATGVFDPKLWWLVMQRGEPRGCMLMARSPEQRTVELVYLGLSPELRGRGLAQGLLSLGLAKAGTPPEGVACAVDLRNEPALRLYRRFGFREFSRRVALVRPL
jgi:ribosomal protein S18 acetylase RimI-like enzyme